MLTIDKLTEFGADTTSGVKRCAGNEALYLRLVGMVPANTSFYNLYEAIKNNNLDEAFNNAHALKGILANLSLEPLLKPVLEITEHLRNKEELDYSNLIKSIEENRKKLENLI